MGGGEESLSPAGCVSPGWNNGPFLLLACPRPVADPVGLKIDLASSRERGERYILCAGAGKVKRACALIY